MEENTELLNRLLKTLVNRTRNRWWSHVSSCVDEVESEALVAIAFTVRKFPRLLLKKTKRWRGFEELYAYGRLTDGLRAAKILPPRENNRDFPVVKTNIPEGLLLKVEDQGRGYELVDLEDECQVMLNRWRDYGPMLAKRTGLTSRHLRRKVRWLLETVQVDLGKELAGDNGR